MWPVGQHLFFSPLSGQPVRVERKMNIDLTEDELCALMDCINGRIDDLTDCAMFGDAAEIEGEIENLQELNTKLGDAFEASR
jgi:hypothetical protein